MTLAERPRQRVVDPRSRVRLPGVTPKGKEEENEEMKNGLSGCEVRHAAIVFLLSVFIE